MITSIDKNTALVLIDLQKGIVAYPLVNPIKDVLEKVSLLVEAFRSAHLPIVVVNVNPAGAWTKTRKDASPNRSSVSAAEWLDITPEVKTQQDDIFITKHTWNAFFDTALDDELKKRNITGIVLAGVSTSLGVEGTARAASERGYNIAFAKDAMTDMFAEAQERSQKYIFPRIGEIGDTDEIIEKLS